uniref:Anaphase-promoting complex subunit 4 n=2 Tax=Rhizophora mucronata TaxID=61149 RepID=A0A2P2INE0_RHIMU
METDEEQQVLPFQLQFDKPLPSQIKIAEWNPEKDLLAMVTDDYKILLHRFNWQRLWTVSPGRCIMSLCWRPDGKAIAVGLEDGSISLHDVENGKLLRRVKSHNVAVVCLNWEEDAQLIAGDDHNFSTFEDRTPHFFPPAPRIPRLPGIMSGDTGFMEDGEDSYRELSNSSYQRFNILCSGDKEGSICFSIFGIFPIGKINIHNFAVPLPLVDKQAIYWLSNASIHKVALSKDLCHLIVVCSGKLNEKVDSWESQVVEYNVHGLHGLVLDTSIFSRRKNQLHQLAQQASNIEDLTEVIRASLSVMCKQWSDAMHTFHEKFDSLSTLIIDHDLDSTPQEEFLSLLCGARTSPPVHQFLVNSLGEVGMKRVSKVVCGAGKELQQIVLDHLQPAAEIIGFRMGELRGLSRWRAHYQAIGLDEVLINNATEKSGMMLVQVERFMRILSSVEQQFSNFFNWLLKCIKLLMQEPSDQLLPYNSELVVIFLKFLYDQDPVRQLLEPSEIDCNIDVDLATMQRVKELVQFGGFSDCEYLQRTLAKEFQQMESSFKEAFLLPFTAISGKILCEDLLPLFPFPSSPASISVPIPMSISYYEDTSMAVPSHQNCKRGFVDYMCFQIPTEPFSETANCIGITRGFMHDLTSLKSGFTSLETTLLSVPPGYDCVDLSLYKESQIVLLLNEKSNSSKSPGDACMMIVQASELPFTPLSRSTGLDLWKLQQPKDSAVQLQMENEKVRSIPYSVIAPLAVSASRGVACVFAARKRALVYILDEDEEVTDAE